MADPKKIRADANALAVELLARLRRDDLETLEVRRGPVRVRVSKEAQAAPVATAPAAPQAAAASRASAVTVAPEPARAEGRTVNAPLTGVFYRSPSPQAGSFVEVGSVVAQGDVVGLIEAMKLFNEIRSTVSGRVVRILAENGQLVRAHQPILELE